MIFIFPDASNQLKGSMYLSSPTIGDYETYITQELVELVDATYRTIPNRNSRGITGCSMGGDGSIYLALKYPGVFSAAAPASATYDWARNPIWWKEGPEPLAKAHPRISMASQNCRGRLRLPLPQPRLRRPILISHPSTWICPLL